MAADDRPTLSVVVMGYRDADTIVRAVESIVAQADDDVEIVVVTSGGDDTAARVGAAFPALAVVESPTRLLPGATRNRGVAATRARSFAFLEGDCVAEPGWIAGRRRCHAEGHPVVASAVTNGDRRHPAAWAAHFSLFGDRLAGRRAGPVAGIDGAAHGCSFVREVLDRIGGFREDVEMGEDTIAAYAAAEQGIPIWFEPTVRTRHWGPTTLAGLVRDRYRRGRRRGRTYGPVEPSRIRALGRGWGVRGVRVYWRDAGADRWHVVACLPWLLVGNVAARAGREWAGRAFPAGTIPPARRG